MTAIGMSTAETVGSLIERIQEFIGPEAALHMHATSVGADVFVHGLDPARFPAHKLNEAAGTVVMSRTNASNMLMVTGHATLLGALQKTAAYLVFPPQSGATLRAVHLPDGE